MTKSELNDLMKKVSSGDEDAFAIFYQSAYKSVFGFLYSYVNDRTASEDLLQDTFIKVKEKAYTYKEGTNAFAWVLQIAKNTAIDYLRKENRIKKEELNETVVGTLAKPERDFYIHDAINKYLEDGERQIFILHAVYGYKNKEIAQILTMPLGTVLWKYNRAVKTLKEKLKEDGYEN